jgi:hypothetical protein
MPDITYAVHSVAKHRAHPTLEVVHACSKILGYIRVRNLETLRFRRWGVTRAVLH